MFESMYIVEQVYKVVTPSKNTTRADSNHTSNGRIYTGGESASSNSMRRAALLSARKIIQAIRAIGQLVKNTIGAWPRGLNRRLWSTQGIFREVRHAAAIQRQRIPLWRGKNRDQTVKLNVNIQEVNTMVSHDSPILSKNKVKKQKKNLRVIRLMQTHQRMEALMVLTAWTWENL